MNKTAIYILFLGIFLNSATGQTYFSKRIDVFNQSADMVSSMSIGKDRYILTTGSIGSNGNQLLGLVGVDLYGNTLFRKTYQFGQSIPREGKSIALLDGNFMLWNTYQEQDQQTQEWYTWAVLFKYDQNGDTIWTKSFRELGKIIMAIDLVQTPDSSIFLLGTYGDHPDIDAFIFRVDDAGVEIDRLVINSSKADLPVHLCFHNEDLYLRGISNEKGTHRFDTYDWICRLDTSLNVKFNKYYNERADIGGGLIPLSNGNLVICSDTIVSFDRSFLWGDTTIWRLKWIDKNGNIYRQKKIGSPSVDIGLREGVELPNGNLLIYGLRSDKGHNTAYLFETSALGEPLRENTYSYDASLGTSQWPWQFGEAPNGGYVIGGSVNPESPPGQDVWLLKVDSAQCRDAECSSLVYDKRTIGIKDNYGVKIELRVFPNPTNGLITISISEAQNFTLKLVDLQGRKVLERAKFYKTTRGNLDVSEIPNGMYMLQFRSELDPIQTFPLLISK